MTESILVYSFGFKRADGGTQKLNAILQTDQKSTSGQNSGAALGGSCPAPMRGHNPPADRS